MQTQSFRTLKNLAIGGVAAALAMTIVGCGDMITYSGQAKQQGMSQYNDGHYAEAAGSFRNAIRQNPTDASSEYWLGMSYEQIKANHQAIDAYKTCLHQMPKQNSPTFNAELYANAFEHLANVVAVTDVSSTEIDSITQSAMENKSTEEKASEQYRLLARILRYRGDADSALDGYRRSVRLDPANYAAQKELGIYLEKLTQNQEAADVLRTAYRMNQSDKDVNDALRQIGMVPGPGLLAQSQLAKPLITGDIQADLGMSSPAAHSAAPGGDVAIPKD